MTNKIKLGLSGLALGATIGLTATFGFPTIGDVSIWQKGADAVVRVFPADTEINYPAAVNEALTFTVGATTTPGGLVSIQNNSGDKICANLTVDLTGAITDQYVYKFATSTTASAWSANGGGLIASSTVPTSTSLILNNKRNGNDTGSWLWENGVYLLGAFDSDGVSAGSGDNASSTPYTANGAGKVYISCHTR